MTERPATSTFAAAFDRTLRLSRFAARTAHAHPEFAAELESRGAEPVARAQMHAALGEDGDLAVKVRRLRSRTLLTLAHRDLNGLASLDEVFETMTALAEESVRAAVAHAYQEAVERFGPPSTSSGSASTGSARTEAEAVRPELVEERTVAEAVRPELVEGRTPGLIVAALGKLGGCELNVSSDIDLVFLYDEEGETTGPRPVTHSEFFAHAGRTVIALLSEITAEGLAFRVDMRLRPFGDGPLATSLGGLEDYFVAHARPWERYAWLKARVIAGSADEVRALVEPFVYRRYLDYGLLGALRDLHARIFETAVQRRKADDIKLGLGGIREIEFAVQLFQMVRGGRDRGLQLTSTRAALAALAQRGLIEPERALSLGEAYSFLRRLEHRLQYYDDQQTQALPRNDEHRAAIAEAMDFAGWDALHAALERHRAAVQEAFNALFEDSAAPVHSAAERITAWLNDPQAAPDPEGLAEDLGEAGIAPARTAADRLIEFTRTRRYRAMSGGLRSKVEKLLPALVSVTVETGGDARTLARLLEIFAAIDRREAYFSLLLEYPQVLARAARLASKSAWAARLIARHPILLDELTKTAASFKATDWKAEREDLLAECRGHGSDLERVLDDLRHFKQRHVLRLTIADVEGELAVMALSDELSALADAVLDVTLVLASSPATTSSPAIASVTTSSPAIASAIDGRGSNPSAGFAIVGYGKLGGKELGYGSDLDLVFLYDAERTSAEVAPRLAQRLITWLTTHTPAGVLYDTDMRLRPDGEKGVMVSTLRGFDSYERTRAWTWEHQALTRARFCAGDPALGAAFERVKDEILATPRDAAKVIDDIRAMRRRMRAEQKRDADEIKHIEGGVIDLEFCVQALVLLHGPRHPQLRENKGNHALLQRAGELGLIDSPLAAEAGQAYLTYRRRIHEAALNEEERVIVKGDDLAAERAAVRRLWSVVL